MMVSGVHTNNLAAIPFTLRFCCFILWIERNILSNSKYICQILSAIKICVLKSSYENSLKSGLIYIYVINFSYFQSTINDFKMTLNCKLFKCYLENFLGKLNSFFSFANCQEYSVHIALYLYT